MAEAGLGLGARASAWLARPFRALSAQDLRKALYRPEIDGLRFFFAIAFVRPRLRC